MEGAFQESLTPPQEPETALVPPPAGFASLKPTESHDESRKKTFGFGWNRKFSHS
jgi:hypothetical protein